MPRYDERDRKKMLELVAMGYSYAAVGRRFGCTGAYVAELLTKRVDKKVDASKEQKQGRKAPRWLEALPDTVDLSEA